MQRLSRSHNAHSALPLKSTLLSSSARDCRRHFKAWLTFAVNIRRTPVWLEGQRRRRDGLQNNTPLTRRT
eukprot:4046143-Pleurochrysis_carterae.AAC.1